MAKKANPVKEAVAIVGGPTRAAHICDVSNTAIHQWIKAGRVVTLSSALKLAEASGIAIKELAGE
jgi:DNA-binding transcriptional regulator YdaS (Cro superfamily)